MAASQIFLLRHAQKPRHHHPHEGGVSEDGSPDPESLSVLGWQHAGAIALLFAMPEPVLRPLGLARPDALVVSPPEKREENGGPARREVGSHSRRPLQTLAPLARRLGLPLVTDHLRGEEPRLVADIVARDGVVLVAWQHEELPQIGRLIAGETAGVPETWPDELYDRVWRFTRRGSEGWDFAEITLPTAETAPAGPPR
jgi:broad specificity phosphatase PhoE